MDGPILPGRYCCFRGHFKHVNHVIFDLDGTILDTDLIEKNVFKQIIAELGSEYTDEVNLVKQGTNEIDACTKIIQLLQLDIEPEELQKKLQQKLYGIVSNAKFMPGIKDLVTHFYEQQIPMAIATSSTYESVDAKISKKKEFFDMFSHIVCGSSDPEVLRGKPYPNIYYIAARRFINRPSRSKCLVFEDAFAGVKAALGAGMQVVMTPSTFMPYEKWKFATMRLDSLKQFVPELFGLPTFGSPIPQAKPKTELIEPSKNP